MSNSFLVAVLLVPVLVMMVSAFIFTPKVVATLILLFCISGTALLLIVINVPRTSALIDQVTVSLPILINNPFEGVPKLIWNQYNSFFPLITLWLEATTGNIWSIAFGSGIGSSGVLNSAVLGVPVNPAPQAVRLVYEFGLFGVSVFPVILFEVLRRSLVG